MLFIIIFSSYLVKNLLVCIIYLTLLPIFLFVFCIKNYGTCVIILHAGYTLPTFEVMAQKVVEVEKLLNCQMEIKHAKESILRISVAKGNFDL